MKPAAAERRTEDAPLTREALDAALAEFKKDQEWTLGEWYEKFQTLHNRVVKRAQRAEGREVSRNHVEPEEEEPILSMAHLRRFP